MTPYLATLVWGALIGLLVGYGIARREIRKYREAASHWRQAAELWERIR